MSAFILSDVVMAEKRDLIWVVTDPFCCQEDKLYVLSSKAKGPV